MNVMPRSRPVLSALFLVLVPWYSLHAQHYGKGTLVLNTGETLEGEIREVEGGYEINLPGEKFGVPDPVVTVNYPKNEVKEVQWANAPAKEAQLETPAGYEEIEELLKDPEKAKEALKLLDERTDDDRAVPDHHWMVARAARSAGDVFRSATACLLFRHLGGNDATITELVDWLKAQGVALSEEAARSAADPAKAAVLQSTAAACDAEIMMKSPADTAKNTFKQLEALEVEASESGTGWHDAALRLAWYATLAGHLEPASEVSEKILASEATKAVHWEAGALMTRINADLEAIRQDEKLAGNPAEAEPPPEGESPAPEEALWTDRGEGYHDYSAVTGTEAKIVPGDLSGLRQNDLLELARDGGKYEKRSFPLSNQEGDRWKFTVTRDEAKQILGGKPVTKKTDSPAGKTKENVDVTLFREK